MDSIKLDNGVRACSGIAGMHLMIRGNVAEEGAKIIGLCCENKPNRPEIAFDGTAEDTLQRLIGMRHMLFMECIKYSGDYKQAGVYLPRCLDCVQFQKNRSKGYWTFKTQIDCVNISTYPSPCQAKCIYCAANRSWENSTRVKEGYEKCFRLLQTAEDIGLIDPDARWDVAPGEVTIHPYRKRFLEVVKGKKARFYTNCMVFDEGIARHLGDVPGSSVHFSIDAGTSETWYKVKGINNFQTTVENFKRYCASSADLNNFQLKYILMHGKNDSEADFESVINLMLDCGLKTLALSSDFRETYQHDNETRGMLLERAKVLAVLSTKNGIRPHICNFCTEQERAEIVDAAGE